MSAKPVILGMDMEGCLTPEIWINLAEKTRIPELRLTTRDISNYDELMRRRLAILAEHGLTIKDIQAVIAEMDPLPGARDYLDRIRARTQIIILSDTFYEFARPLMVKLGYPTLLCHTLEIDADHRIVNYRLRAKDGKRGAIEGLQNNGFFVIAIGDSYNDTTMLKQADRGILFRAPEKVIAEFPQFPVCQAYEQLEAQIEEFMP